jgi:arabinofuranan 3-O-arabinosyltransferase
VEPGHRPEEALTAPDRAGGSRLRLRTAAASMVLVGLAFIQNPGLLVPDTKFDLAVRPLEFLARALHLWDTDGAFGQLQNQAYGYLWPMGPFFVLGDAVGLPDWVVQRLWIAVVMVVAFVGAVLVARALEIRSDLACLVAGFAYALSPRMISTLGPISIEAWPGALAPWVLLPLVVGADRGSPRRMAMLSGLAVAMVGGVNAAATFAVLPLGIVWLLTRRAGPRRRSLMVWWPVFTLLGTLWWLVPLFLMGAYSPPFLDFIETSSVTTFPTTPFDALRGTSAWVPYLDPTWQGGNELLTTGYMALNSGLLLLLGLTGIMRRDHPHRQFLVLSLLVGLLLVTWGHDGSTSGWFSSVLRGQLDEALAPLRNVHKYDPIIRLPMVIGVGLLLDRGLAELRARRATDPARDAPGLAGFLDRATPGALVGLALVGLVGSTIPATAADLTTTKPVFGTPGYWQDTAAWLEENTDGGVALLAPGTGFATYLWGEPRDEPMQWLAGSRWAVRNAIPLAPPGNIRMLDAFEQRMAQGRGSTGLATYLRRAGVQYVVVRNDLAPSSDVPDPVLVHQALADSPGLDLVETFGPEVGGGPSITRDERRLVVDGGWQSRWRAIEVFEVEDSAPAASASRLPVVVGGPEDLLDLADAGVLEDEPTRLAVDADPDVAPDGPLVLTDGMLDRERFFGRVHDAYSAVRTPGDVPRSGNPVADYTLGDGGPRWRTTAALLGARTVSASSSLSDANTAGGARPADLPYAAVDGDDATSWVSRETTTGAAPWWRVGFDEPQALSTIDVTVAEDAGRERVRVVTETGRSDVVLVEAGATESVTLPAGLTRWLRVEAAGGGSRRMTLAEVSWPGRDVTRRLVLPKVPDAWGAPDVVLLRALRDARTGCAEVEESVRCQEKRTVDAEEPTGFDRVVTLPADRSYDAQLVALPRAGGDLLAALQEDQAVNVTGSSTSVPDLRASGIAAFDGDLGTTWTPQGVDTRPQLNLNWLGRRTLRAISIRTESGAPARRPRSVRLVWPGGSRTVELDRGRARLRPAIRSDRISVRVLSAENAVDIDRDGNRGELPVGIGEIRLRGLGYRPLALSAAERAWRCGSGPTFAVDGVPERSRLVASPADLFAMRPIVAEPCRASRPVALRAGQNVVSARAGDLSVPSRLVLGSGGGSLPAPAAGLVFDGTERTVRPVPGGGYLTVRENTNRGWVAEQDGRALSGTVVDGWQQGWVTDGSRDPVDVRFAPDRAYRIGLAVGAGTLLLLLLLALIPRRRWRGSDLAPVAAAHVPSPVVLGLGAAAAGLIAGWPGLGCFALAVAVGSVRAVRESEAFPWLASGLLVVASGAYFVRPWGSVGGWAGAWAWPHYLVVAAVSVAVVLAADLRPRSLRR